MCQPVESKHMKRMQQQPKDRIESPKMHGSEGARSGASAGSMRVNWHYDDIVS